MKKRIVAMILVIVMVLSLTACGSGDTKKLVGKWRCEVDWTELMEDMMFDSNEDWIEYVDFGKLTMVCYAEFRENGTVVMYVDEDQIRDVFDGMIDDLVAGLETYMVDLIYEQTGMTFTFEEILELSGMDLEAELENMNLDDMVQEICDEVYQEGKYKAEDGKLYVSAGLDYNIDPEVYETYTLTEDTFTLITNASDADFNIPIMVFERVG